MYHPYYDMVITSGYLIVLRFSALYDKYARRYQDDAGYRGSPPLYAMPGVDRPWSESAIQYRGTDRDALGPNLVAPANLAEVFLDDLEKQRRCPEGLLFTQEDVVAALSWLDDQEADQYEVIWVREHGTEDAPPEGFVFLGYEPSYFTGDHFSPSCDCMLIPRWHGTDQEGVAFLEYFRCLNRYGLFDSPQDAEAFLEYYLSFDWTEHVGGWGGYLIVDVFAEREASR